ncbi:DUF3857 domain-containing protein [Mucilaginibacter sp.]
MQKYFTSIIISTVFILFFINTNARSQDVPKDLYIAAGIPDSLKEDANSVVRYSMQDEAVKGPNDVVYKYHSVVTILNDKADNEAAISLPYNRKYSSINSFEMIIYDETGKMIKKYHKSDMYDHAVLDDETLVSDDRAMSIRHTIANYPETVEMIYEIDESSLMGIGAWEIEGEQQSVQNEYCHVSISGDAGFRYLNKNTNIKPQKTTDDKTDNYKWQVSNLKAIKIEDGAEGWRVYPEVEFGMNKFICYGFPGDFTSWQSFGKWIYNLNKDVCTLNPTRAAEIRKMTDTIKSDKDKAKFLYQYMQQSMRYVAVSLGIGGLKPFSADFVDQKKYGDCKALANYMYALLNAVNIKSYWAIIYRGTNASPANVDFPVYDFNHEILCIPFKNDTTWLECTGSTQPFGKLDLSTQNRNALLITEDGGKLINTPLSNADENQFNSEVHLAIDSDGSAKAQVKILSTGSYRDDYIELSYQKTDDQKEFLMRALNIKQPSVFDFKQGKDENGVKEVNLHLEYDKFCDIMAGNKQFYKARVFDLCAFTVPILDKRNSDYYYESPIKKTCVTTIDLPANYEIETLPANQNLKFTYGNYEVSYVYNAAKNQIISTAKFIIANQVIPAAKYAEMQQYLDAVAKAQNKKLVIRRKA